jgi:hypothetical protein
MRSSTNFQWKRKGMCFCLVCGYPLNYWFDSVHLHIEGRVIHRLVCLTERVEDLIAEFDRRVTLGIELDDYASMNDPKWVLWHLQLLVLICTTRDDRMYRSYKKLATWCPSVRKLVHSVVEDSELSCIYSKVGHVHLLVTILIGTLFLVT